MVAWQKGTTLAVSAAGASLLVVAHWCFAPAPRLGHIQTLINARDYDEGQRLLERLLRRQPGNYQARLMLAGMLVERERRESAIEHLLRIPDTADWAIEARFREGWLVRQSGRAIEAERAWLRCLALDASFNRSEMSPAARSATVELLGLYIVQRRERDGRRLIWNWYGRVPQEDRAHAAIALVALEFNPGPPAEQIAAELESFVASNPQDNHSRQALGRMYVELGREEEGRDLLQACVDEQPDDLESMTAYLWCLTEQGDLEAAQVVLARLPDAADEDPDLWPLRGIVHELAKEWQDAEHCFRRSLSLEPWRRESHAHLANMLRRQGEVAAAQEHERRANELHEVDQQLRNAAQSLRNSLARPNVASCLMLGELYEKRGQTQEARAWYDETLRLQPRHAVAQAAIERLSRAAVRR